MLISVTLATLWRMQKQVFSMAFRSDRTRQYPDQTIKKQTLYITVLIITLGKKCLCASFPLLKFTRHNIYSNTWRVINILVLHLSPPPPCPSFLESDMDL